MHDTFNLAWKIGLVVNGIAKPHILKTYQSERRRIAQDLIDFDHKFSRLFSGRPAKDAADEAGVSMSVFKEAFEKGNMFASGIAVDYGKNVLVAKPGSAVDQGDGTDVGPESQGGRNIVGKQDLATGIKLGMRFPSFQVLNQSDARPWQFAQWLKADGRFRVVLFAGDVTKSEQKGRVETFCSALEPIVQKYTPQNAPKHAVIDILTIHSAERQSVDIFSFPELLRPFDDKKGWDYDSIFVDAPSYHEGFGEAYKNYGVDKSQGCVVISRPDQYIGYIGSLEDASEIESYFDTILVPAKDRKPEVNGKVKEKTESREMPKSKDFELVNERSKDATAKPLDGAAGSVM